MGHYDGTTMSDQQHFHEMYAESPLHPETDSSHYEDPPTNPSVVHNSYRPGPNEFNSYPKNYYEKQNVHQESKNISTFINKPRTRGRLRKGLQILVDRMTN